MTLYTLINIEDVEGSATRCGLSPSLEARFARKALGSSNLGVSRETLAPGFRVPFGHTHREQEEVYVVLRGSGRIKIDDEIVELGEGDLVRVPPGGWRCTECSVSSAMPPSSSRSNTHTSSDGRFDAAVLMIRYLPRYSMS